MSHIIDFLSGTHILEEVESPVNGKITVIRSLVFGTYIQVGGLTQSGGILYNVWKKPLKKVARQYSPAKNILILGLGGGTLVKLVNEFWPNAKITAVDIDPIMVEMGKKYLGLDTNKVKIYISDALNFLTTDKRQSETGYDLILIDLYIGFNYPAKFEQDKFLKLVHKTLPSDGMVIFNRLYYGDKRSVAVKFGERLDKIFSKVDVVYPEANIMFVCHK